MLSSCIIQNSVCQYSNRNTLSMPSSNPGHCTAVKVLLCILCCAGDQCTLEMEHFSKSIKTSKPIGFPFA